MIRDNDIFNYYPLKDGKIPISSAKTTTWSQVPEYRRYVFQSDPCSETFLENKKACLNERPEKYYQNICNQNGIDLTPVYKFLLNEFSKVSSQEKLEEIISSTTNRDLFDTIAGNLPEDFVLISCDSNTGKDFISLAHLMSPSDWGAEFAIGKSFAEIHENVRKANGELVLKNIEGLIRGLIKMKEYTERVGAISFRSTSALNRHPENAPQDVWTWDNHQELFMRFERQVIVPFPEINSFMLIIKSYYNDLTADNRIDAAISAFQDISPDVYGKKFCREQGQNAYNFLQKIKSQANK